jgi:hypothetical protein
VKTKNMLNKPIVSLRHYEAKDQYLHMIASINARKKMREFKNVSLCRPAALINKTQADMMDESLIQNSCSKICLKSLNVRGIYLKKSKEKCSWKITSIW